MNTSKLESDNMAEDLNYEDTIVLTSTLYDDSPGGIARSEAARNFLKNSTITGIRVVVCDGGSGKDFLDFVNTFTNVTLLEYHDNPELQKSHAPRRKDGMSYILKNLPDKKIIFWTEPEKADILLPKNLSRIIRPLRDGVAEQTIPTAKPNDNRPEYMRAIEMRAMRRAMDIVKHGKFRPRNETYEIQSNTTTEQIMQKIYDEPTESSDIIDHWFGPHAFTREIAQDYFMRSDRKGSDWIILPSARAQYEKRKTIGVNIDFQYAPTQLADESSAARIPVLKKKRFEQYKILIKAFREEFISKLNTTR